MLSLSARSPLGRSKSGDGGGGRGADERMDWRDKRMDTPGGPRTAKFEISAVPAVCLEVNLITAHFRCIFILKTHSSVVEDIDKFIGSGEGVTSRRTRFEKNDGQVGVEKERV